MALRFITKPPPPVTPGQERLYHGDLFDVLPTLEEYFFDACVCDPPYGLEFMGKAWDTLGGRERDYEPRSEEGYGDKEILLGYGRGGLNADRAKFNCKANQEAQAWHERWAREVFRVLKPGAHLIAFGGTRTSHRMVCALEDAGFEIRDTICWLYGSGFPKSLDVSKAFDEAAGVAREVIGPSTRHAGVTSKSAPIADFARYGSSEDVVTAPHTALAKQWAGWGTGLKPAYEPIVLARKPFIIGTVIDNVRQRGTGALNIDASRIQTRENLNGGAYAEDGTDRPTYAYWRFKRLGDAGPYVQPQGRWPANVILDEEAGALLDGETGNVGGGFGTENREVGTGIYGKFSGATRGRTVGFGDKGGASRFFYCAKASRKERDAGCAALPIQRVGSGDDRPSGSMHERMGGKAVLGRNTHPTVKPLALMRYLVKLIAPPGGIVLDPFMGSGTTGMACRYEGHPFVGVEQDSDYHQISERRIKSVKA